MTQEVAVDVLSWARRVGDAVSVRLRLPRTSLAAGPIEVTLSVAGSADRLVVPAEVTVDDDARVLSFELDQGTLAGSVWKLGLLSPIDGHVPMSTRLLATPGTPVALLLEPAPDVRPLPPQRRRSVTRIAASRAVSRLPSRARNVLLTVRDHGGQILPRSGR